MSGPPAPRDVFDSVADEVERIAHAFDAGDRRHAEVGRVANMVRALPRPESYDAAPVPEWLAQLRRNLATQDNAATKHPLFIVQQRNRIYGVDSGYTDDHVWMDEDWNEQPDPDDEDNPPKGWTRVGYLDQWEFVTACFTGHGCKAYIEANGHNLCKPRIYIESAHRNREWQRVREWLAGAPAAGPSWTQDLGKLRADGWSVAVHNDYRQGGRQHTFWLFTRDGRAVKGEGTTDAEALRQCRADALSALDHAQPEPTEQPTGRESCRHWEQGESTEWCNAGSPRPCNVYVAEDCVLYEPAEQPAAVAGNACGDCIREAIGGPPGTSMPRTCAHTEPTDQPDERRRDCITCRGGTNGGFGTLCSEWLTCSDGGYSEFRPREHPAERQGNTSG